MSGMFILRCDHEDCDKRTPQGMCFAVYCQNPKYGNPRPQKTNADHIRGMSDYEMAEWIADILNHCDNKTPEEECLESCPLYACCNLPFDNIENWLKSPAKKDGES